jgi:phosphoribosylamine--glycine ligase
MDILVVGSGGREHALVWKLKQSKKVRNIFVTPGNAGTSLLAKNLDLSKTDEIVDWLKKNPIDLIVIGPDNYLAEGMADKIQALGIKVFGPTKVAAEIEWSKSYAKRLMREEGIPNATFKTFKDYDAAVEYVKNQEFPLVIKANGLALGKGVVIAENFDQAEKSLIRMMKEKLFGEAGNEVVIEEYLEGKEISIHAFCDGKHAVKFPASQDHKRIFDGDKGPNTGGMGTIAPIPWVTIAQMQEIKEKIVLPTLAALKKRGRPFKGILFPGIMITKNGLKVIEFNARFGDPETQSYMRILETDLADILLACADGTLGRQKIKWLEKSACCIVCASGGYPSVYEKGKVVQGLQNVDKNIVIFHAGTKITNDEIVTNGGRVLGITAVGDSLKESLTKAYDAAKNISFDRMFYRKDIGSKSLQ